MAVGTTYFARSGVPGGLVLLNGTATPPSSIQAAQIPRLTVNMVMNLADTQGTITHNWGLDASAPTYFDPEVWYTMQNGSGTASGTWVPQLSFDLTNTNAVLVNKLAGSAATGAAGTFIITLRRPWSPGQ